MELSSEQWCSLSGLYTAEEADFMAQLLGNYQVPAADPIYANFNLEIPSSSAALIWPAGGIHDESTIVSVVDTPASTNSTTTDHISQGSTSIADFYNPIEEQEDNNIVKSRKKQKTAFTSNIEEDAISPTGYHQQGQSLRSEDDDDDEYSKASQKQLINAAGGGSSSSLQIPGDSSSTGLKLKGKSRPSKGSSNDTQCIYAKKRRERINERLKILQNLVPNGTKVDISTMLEEAVQYVKFLQLQIKLLSSDDLWMYAPIAYNGMDIGLDLNIIIPTKLP